MPENVFKNASAITYFNEAAEKLLGLLVEMNEFETTIPIIRSVQEEPIPEIDVSEIKYSFKCLIDPQGREIARYFQVTENRWLGIDGDNYQEVGKISANLIKRQEIRDRIGEDTLVGMIFEWLKDKTSDNPAKHLLFIDYLERGIAQKIENIRISIPLINMEIDFVFNVGKVKFEFLKRGLFDDIEAKLKERVESKEMTEDEFITIAANLRKDYQGKVVGTINVNAELTKAIEIGEKEIERAIVALKFYSPFALFPRTSAFFGRKGMTWQPLREVLTFTDTFPIIHQALIGKQNYVYKIDRHVLDKIRTAGLDKLSGMLVRNDLTEFEDLIFTALFTFNKAISYVDSHEKLIFILSTLEIILLKDSGEPIQISVGQRLGFLTARSIEKRMEAVSLIREAYNIRSNYIHHGRENENYELLIKLQHACWNTLNIMINNHDKYLDKKGFMSYIEKLIYSKE